MRIGPAWWHAHGFRQPQAPYLPGTIVHNTSTARADPNPSVTPYSQVKTPIQCGDYRRSMPVANRITMSVNTRSVSTPFIAPVISSSTKPCIADQNSNAA